MNIALDYDNTFTKDPEFWKKFVDLADSYEHEVFIVTARNEDIDHIEDSMGIPILYCDGVAKKWKCHHHFHIDFDVWIDDKPESILANSPFTREQLAEWRANGRV